MATASSRLALAFVLALVAASLGCSSSSAGPSADAAAVEDATDATPADAPDALAEDAAGCTAKRTPAAAPTCGATCDVRLLLPGGDKYCTMTCAKTADCASLGAGLVCSTVVGTCMPACAADGECTAAGFARCDATVGACDTL